MRKVVREKTIEYSKDFGVSDLVKEQEKTRWPKIVDVVEILPVVGRSSGLVLRHRIYQRITSSGVWDKQTSDTVGKWSKKA